MEKLTSETVELSLLVFIFFMLSFVGAIVFGGV